MTHITSYETLISLLADIHFSVTQSNEIHNISISDYPITNLTSAIMPTGYVRLPILRDSPVTAAGGAMWPRFEIELVILINPNRQNLQKENFELGVKVMDALSTELRNLGLAKTKNSFEMRMSKEIMGAYDYWAVVAEITCNG